MLFIKKYLKNGEKDACLFFFHYLCMIYESLCSVILRNERNLQQTYLYL